jgi:hypothetical protein
MNRILERNGRTFRVTTQTRKYTKTGQNGDLLPEPRYSVSELMTEPFAHWNNHNTIDGHGTAATERKALNEGIRRVNAGEFDR